MVQGKRYFIYLVLILSLLGNSYYYFQLQDAKAKLYDTNQMVSQQIESNIRQSMMYARELKETQSPLSMQNLQSTLQELTVSFGHWVNINQSERKPNERLQRGLTGIEVLRNTVVNHLNRQYTSNNNRLTEQDIELLDKVHENLDRLLVVHSKIKDRGNDLKSDKESDGGLGQVAGNIEEMARLYRHSVTPNKHPKYITFDVAVDKAKEVFPYLQRLEIESSENVKLRDGVHYYNLTFYNKDISYTVWVDAINGQIRNYELKSELSSNRSFSQRQANILARDFLSNFYSGDVKEEMFKMQLEGKNNNVIYSFRFTPIKKNITMFSDAFTINIDSGIGDVIKYSNDFISSQIPVTESILEVEEIQEKHQEDIGNMEYDGLAVIRSFETRYLPRLTHRFKTTKNDQQIIILFDAETGQQLLEMYYIYVAVD
ncbi:PepSY domain-containing protein [Alkaliphilus peptidifermentans]|uniref:Peptidase propeptide and YPEB domain-containing protein n=1 Tax=Alkaliphilus peptidifermentans DSM 18978 TaxID=1120976 RepID=A0A1G5IAP8_9FIRM|nr:PepSY domain-containing protein [Alkaliphilus peptidifermentans]SCY73225.1 Peptidase propeptide and YPEB domain-containing protein [Alkaliphilus peptidifermentans DSM 18978]